MKKHQKKLLWFQVLFSWIVLSLFLFTSLVAQEKETEKASGEFVIENASGNEVVSEKTVRKKKKNESYLIQVTAQKRKQNIQDVPGSVSAFNVKQIQDADIKSTNEIHEYVPNFSSYSMDNGYSFHSIRGQSNFIMHSNSIGMYIDDVPLVQSSFMTDSGLYEIERIEVLRGAQGNLYGFNSAGGVINVITKKPDNFWMARSSAKYGNYNLRSYTGSVSGPVVKDSLYMGFAGTYTSRENYIENDGTDKHRKILSAGRYQARWIPVKDLDILFTASLNNRDQGGNKWTLIDDDPFQMTNPGMTEKTEIANDKESLRIKYLLPGFMVTSITARSVAKYDSNCSMDFTSGGKNYSYFLYDDKSVNWMQELRLNSVNKKDPFQWLAGMFYLNKNFSSDMDNAMDTGLAGGGTPSGVYGHQVIDADISGNAASLFGQASYTFFKKLTVTCGLRYDYDKKEIDLDAGAGKIDDSKTDHVLSPRVSVDFRLHESVMTYVSAARGYKSGGYASACADLDAAAFDPEYSWTYECGVKTNWFKNRVVANIAGFYTTVDDIQVLDTSYNLFSYKNAAEAQLAGFELEATLRPFAGLEIIASFGYLFTEYTDHNNSDYKGNKLALAPSCESGFAVQYVSPWGIFVRAEGNWKDDIYFDEGNSLKQDSYMLINTRAGYKTSNVDLSVYINNITDKEYYNFMMARSGGIGGIGQPRTFGVQATLEL